MPTVTYDGRSFLVGGRRIWITSGSVPYARIPHELWADRLHAARLAGLNTVETPVFWNRHEPIPGQFDFTGDNDIRHFVQLAAKAGLWVILRPGPFVGSGWDFGGLPAWLLHTEGIQFRTANPRFLEACSRYISALAEQVRDLQVTSSGKGGPILLIQNEMEWTCGHQALAEAYLGELGRYFREAGLSVPTINANHLWQSVEGEIACWSGSDRPLAMMRQLVEVQPDSPRLIIDFPLASAPSVWGGPDRPVLDAPAVVRRLLETLAGGGQFNVSPLVGGTNFGASGGRYPVGAGSYATTTAFPGAPVEEGGEVGPLFHAIRRVSTFATRFGRVLANLDMGRRPIVQDPASLEEAGPVRGGKAAPRCAVVHAAGAQGDVAFVFSDPVSGARRASLLLPDGQTLEVPLGRQAAAWCLFNVALTSRAVLDYCNLCVLGLAGQTLVCFGPAGSEGRLSINGTELALAVPRGKPAVVRHEGITVVVCNEDEVDRAYLLDDAVYLGVSMVGADGAAVPAHGSDQYVVIGSDGDDRVVKGSGAVRGGRPRASLGTWTTATAQEYATGESPRYASIDGPKNLASLGAPWQYGWYRLGVRTSAAKRLKVAFPESGDRLHVYSNGSFVGIAGHGPGASDALTLPLKKGETTVVVLADNLGRACGGTKLGEHKGLYGHAWALKPLRVGKPGIEVGRPVEALSAFAPLWEVGEGDATTPERLTWKFTHRKKSPVFVTIDGYVGRGIVFINDRPVHFIDRSGFERVRIDRDALTMGHNLLQIALLQDERGTDGRPLDVPAALHELARLVRIEEGALCLTEKADWSFARWEPPAASAFHEAGRNDMVGNHGPRWWRTTLEVSDTRWPVRLDLTGMTKGQIYVNGRHLGRYFVSTADRKAVGPQVLYYVPQPWLTGDGHNEVLIFDEHGGNPSKVRVVVETSSEPIRALAGA